RGCRPWSCSTNARATVTTLCSRAASPTCPRPRLLPARRFHQICVAIHARSTATGAPSVPSQPPSRAKLRFVSTSCVSDGRIRIVPSTVENGVIGVRAVWHTPRRLRGGSGGGVLKSEARLELKLLGGFEAHLQGGTALVLPTRKTQALLAYLALPLGQSHPREKLATLLWGDMQNAQARGNLRNALSRIKKTLPKPRASLRFDGASVSLDPSAVDVDVARFERLVADSSPDALGQVAALYRGD